MDRLFGGGEGVPKTNSNYNRSTFLVLGDSKVGKSSLIDAYCNAEYERPKAPKIKETTGVNTYVKKIISSNGRSELIAEFIDFTGDTEFIKELPIFLKILLRDIQELPNITGNTNLGIHGIIIVFDVNNKHSFYDITFWLKWVFDNQLQILTKSMGDEVKAVELANSQKHQILVKQIQQLPIMIVGTKLDYISKTTCYRINDESTYEKSIEHIIKLIKSNMDKNFSFPDYENFLLINKNSTKNDLEWITAFIKSASGIKDDFESNGKEIIASNYTFDRCSFLKRFTEEFNNEKGFFSQILSYFIKNESKPLPL